MDIGQAVTNVSPYKLGIIVFVDLDKGRKPVGSDNLQDENVTDSRMRCYSRIKYCPCPGI